MTNHTSRSNQAVFCTLTVAGMLLGACSWIPKGEAQFDVGIKDRGVASWYGEQFHGRQAANGEIFDMEALTAAHRTMPLGSIVPIGARMSMAAYSISHTRRLCSWAWTTRVLSTSRLRSSGNGVRNSCSIQKRHRDGLHRC